MEGWRDKDAVPDRVRETVEQGNVTVLEKETERREETVYGSYSSLLDEIGKKGKGQENKSRTD